MEINTKPDAFKEINLKEFIEITMKWKWLIIMLILGAVFISIIINFFILESTFEAKAVIMIPNSTTEQQRSTVVENEGLEGLARNLSTLPKMNLKTYVQQFKNERLVENVIRSLQLDEGQYTAKSLSENVSANIINETNLIEIEVTNTDPDLAAVIANKLAEEYIGLISAMNKERMDQSIEIFQAQVIAIEKDLTLANEMLTKFNSQPRNITFIEEELNTMLAALEMSGSTATQINVERLQAELTEKKVEYNRLLRELERLERNYNLFADSLIETQIFGSVDIGKSNIQIVATAIAPTSPIKPNKKLNIGITFVLSMLIGLILPYMLESFDNKIKTVEDVKRHLGLTVIGKIPTKVSRWKWNNTTIEEGANNFLITYFNSKSILAEAFRTLRTNIYFCNLDNSLKKIMVTSSGPNEGKSTVIANLAITVAQTGRKVLVIDADLRKPTLHKIFQVDNILGLTDLLIDNLGQLDVVQQTKIENLDIITSGPIPPNPSELLVSARMDWVLKRGSNNYDMIFIDTPPTVTVTDSVILADKVDGILMVINSNKVKIDIAKQAKEQLEKAKSRLLGVVLNNVKLKADEYQYYHYGEAE